jgi:phosphatidylglycerophosphatase A
VTGPGQRRADDPSRNERAPGGAGRWALAIATLGGAGRSPIVPGTAGTLAALPLAVAVGLWLPTWAAALVTLAVAGIGIWAAEVAAPLLGAKDPGPVVVDEAAGLLVTLLGVPITWASVAGAFVLFRIMDVLKPPPARRAESLPGGWGIMADDLVAGLYAALALRAGLHFWTRIAG